MQAFHEYVDKYRLNAITGRITSAEHTTFWLA